MKSWEERMKMAAKPEVEVPAAKDESKILKGGFLEAVVFFSPECCELTEAQEKILRTVAATARMREKLQLQLIGCGMELDGALETMRRLCNVRQFFESDGISCNAVHAMSSGNASFTPSSR